MSVSFARARIVIGAVVAVALVAILVASATAPSGSKSKTPQHRARNVIIMVSDGMGYNQLAAANLYSDGEFVSQPYERFPYRAGMTTFPDPSVGGGYDAASAWANFDYVKSNPVDSAASASALSTGVKTRNASLGINVNGDPVKHILEYAEERGKATGIVTTVQISHATPAGFVAHNASRYDYTRVANRILRRSAVEVVMGAGNPYFDDNGAPRTPSTSDFRFIGGPATWNGLITGTVGADADNDGDLDPFRLIQTKAEFEQLSTGRTPRRVVGIAQVATTLQQGRGGDASANAYGVPLNRDVPSLSTMTSGALNVLDNDGDGLFLMVEGGAVDWAGHANQKGRIIEEQVDFNAAVETAIRWVEKSSNWNETLLIVTGDHETGHLTGPGSGQTATGPVWTPLVNNGKGVMPGMQFNSRDHTNSLIPIFAKGPGAEYLRSTTTGLDPMRGAYTDNTMIAKAVFARMR